MMPAVQQAEIPPSAFVGVTIPFGNVKANVLADKEPHFQRGNFCEVIRKSRWKS